MKSQKRRVITDLKPSKGDEHRFIGVRLRTRGLERVKEQAKANNMTIQQYMLASLEFAVAMEDSFGEFLESITTPMPRSRS